MPAPKKTETDETMNPSTAETVKDQTATTDGEVSDEALDGVAGGIGGTVAYPPSMPPKG